MEANAVSGLHLLRRIGRNLDSDRYPVVHEGGQVEPGPVYPSRTEPGDNAEEVRQDAGEKERATRERQGSGRSAARPGTGTAEEGATTRERSARPTTSVLSTAGLTAELHHDLEAAAAAYPQMRVRVAPQVVWLSMWIWPIRDLAEAAFLLVKYSLNRLGVHHAWAWWDTGIWIGPRHTNYPTGSICSFEPPDKTWVPGGPLVPLLDLHVVWIVRQMHLRHFGRWPGQQVLHTAYERLHEHESGELCGGCNSGRRYEDCCKERDLTLRDRGLREFMRRVGTLQRNPPIA